MNVEITMSQDTIAKFCELHHIRRLMAFEAETRDIYELGDSDIYVSFKHGHEQEAKSKKLHAMQDELKEILGMDVRLKTRAELSNWLLVSSYGKELIYDGR